MTKLVRIENADTSHYDLEVKTYDKRPDGDVLCDTKVLSPTQQAEVWIHSGKRIIIDEVTK